MKPRTLRELDNADGVVHQAAAEMGGDYKTWLDAAAAHLARRKRDLVAEMMTGTAHDAENSLSYRVKALDYIAGTLGEKLQKEPKLKRREVANSPDSRVASLAAVLCPPGWREKYGTVLDGIYDAAAALVADRKEVPQNQAIGREAREFLTFLQTTDQRGSEARERIDRGRTKRQDVGLSKLRSALRQAM